MALGEIPHVYRTHAAHIWTMVKHHISTEIENKTNASN